MKKRKKRTEEREWKRKRMDKERGIRVDATNFTQSKKER